MFKGAKRPARASSGQGSTAPFETEEGKATCLTPPEGLPLNEEFGGVKLKQLPSPSQRWWLEVLPVLFHSYKGIQPAGSKLEHFPRRALQIPPKSRML